MSTKSNRSSGTQHTQRGVNQGNVLVDPVSGLPVSVTTDGTGKKRLAVDANITAQDIQVNVNLDANEDEVAVADPDTGAHIRVEPDGSINANTEIDANDGDNIAITGHPNQIFDEAADTITTAAFEEIYTYTSANLNTMIRSIECTVSTPATIRLKINGVIKKVLRTSPLERNIKFLFEDDRPLSTGQTVSVEAQVDRLIHASYDCFTSLEGYLK